MMNTCPRSREARGASRGNTRCPPRDDPHSLGSRLGLQGHGTRPNRPLRGRPGVTNRPPRPSAIDDEHVPPVRIDRPASSAVGYGSRTCPPGAGKPEAQAEGIGGAHHETTRIPSAHASGFKDTEHTRHDRSAAARARPTGLLGHRLRIADMPRRCREARGASRGNTRCPPRDDPHSLGSRLGLQGHGTHPPRPLRGRPRVTGPPTRPSSRRRSRAPRRSSGPPPARRGTPPRPSGPPAAPAGRA